MKKVTSFDTEICQDGAVVALTVKDSNEAQETILLKFSKQMFESFVEDCRQELQDADHRESAKTLDFKPFDIKDFVKDVVDAQIKKRTIPPGWESV